MFPGTFEYAERMAARPEIDFHWIYAGQPIVNIFNRELPYFWVFDDRLAPEQWVRQPPKMAYRIPHLNIEMMTIPERFPPPEGKQLMSVIGLRTSESTNRRMGFYSSGSYVTKPDRFGVPHVRPLYDWTDGDIWKAIHEQHWDYNAAYDVMHRLGLPRTRLRIAPPTLMPSGVTALALAAKAWPRWFASVCDRLPGVRTAAHFGLRAVQPMRRLSETWEDCFTRTCIREAPAWIAERSRTYHERLLHRHQRHSTVPFPQAEGCWPCGQVGPADAAPVETWPARWSARWVCP
jgi:predicted phosphoadenosine phosphosulfate sulfurtransferase